MKTSWKRTQSTPRYYCPREDMRERKNPRAFAPIAIGEFSSVEDDAECGVRDSSITLRDREQETGNRQALKSSKRSKPFSSKTLPVSTRVGEGGSLCFCFGLLAARGEGRSTKTSSPPIWHSNQLGIINEPSS